MDFLPLLLAGLAALGVAVLIVLQLRQKAADPRLDALSGQLQQLAAQQSAAQSAAQAAIDQRIGQLGERVADRLNQNAAEAGKSLAELKERLAVIDAAQKNIAELSTQMVSLQDILSNKQSRGAFGEVQLADIVQNIMAPSSYEFQATLSGGKRVDCLLKLPNPPGPIGIDSKFPLESYRAIRDAKDDIAMVAARRDFSVAIRTHIRAIAEKYIVPGETAESALMFLPSESVYAELHANFPNLVEEASRVRVWIVSPTTLMATLTTIRAVLKDVRMREQAHLIQKKVGELGLDVNRLGDRVDKLQKHFFQAEEDVRMIITSADKIAQKAAAIHDVEIAATDGNITQIPEQPAVARLN